MKRPLATIPGLVVSGLLWAQTITITFEGLYNSNPTELDSIRVTNLDQGGDTTIFFPDHELVLAIPTTGQEERDPNQRPLIAFPNPFVDRTEVLVSSMSDPELFIEVSDATGALIASMLAGGGTGSHRFRFSATTPGVYVFSVTQSGMKRAVRLLATGGSHARNTLEYVGRKDPEGDRKGGGGFVWSTGDMIRCIGFVSDSEGPLTALIDLVPTASSTETFQMERGSFCTDMPVVTDVEGHNYLTVQIGDQCWMKENLRTAYYNDGSPIAHVTDSVTWIGLSSEAWCHLDNDPLNEVLRGKLYNWYVIDNSVSVCPAGWHVPTDEDFQELELELGMTMGQLLGIGFRGNDQNVGGKMKSLSPLWWTPNLGATNESGFTGIPCGDRDDDGEFKNHVYGVFLWSTSLQEPDLPWHRGLSFMFGGITRRFGEEADKKDGYSIRCVRD